MGAMLPVFSWVTRVMDWTRWNGFLNFVYLANDTQFHVRLAYCDLMTRIQVKNTGRNCKKGPKVEQLIKRNLSLLNFSFVVSWELFSHAADGTGSGRLQGV